MAKIINLDFSRLARRRRQTDYEGECSHVPDCFVHESHRGDVPVCLMGDFHLLNAYRKVLDNLSNDRLPWDLEVALNEELDELMAEIRLRDIAGLL